jgi:hypothetical protein
MTGRAEVASLRQRLDGTFKRLQGIQADAEVLSDFARYLCVLVSGFLERSLIELVLEHVRLNSSPSVQRHVELRLRRGFMNAKHQRIIDLMSTFDVAWGADLEAFLVDEYRDAVNGIVDLKNKIAHGDFVGVTLSRARDYYALVVRVVEHIADLCLPK